MLDARRLEIYCAVVEEGFFTAAAVRFHLTQSAVSQQIAMLERDLGLALFDAITLPNYRKNPLAVQLLEVLVELRATSGWSGGT